MGIVGFAAHVRAKPPHRCGGRMIQARCPDAVIRMIAQHFVKEGATISANFQNSAVCVFQIPGELSQARARVGQAEHPRAISAIAGCDVLVSRSVVFPNAKHHLPRLEPGKRKTKKVCQRNCALPHAHEFDRRPQNQPKTNANFFVGNQRLATPQEVTASSTPAALIARHAAFK